MSRVVRKSSSFCKHEVRELIQAIFCAELLSPSETLWIVSPWISDIVVVDNRAGTFDGLAPDLPPSRWRLVDVLLRLVDRGVDLRIATRPDNHNQKVLERLRREAGPSGAVSISRVDDLHEKGILGSGFFLSGSMNLTYNGVEVLEERVEFVTDAEELARHRVAYNARWARVAIVSR